MRFKTGRYGIEIIPENDQDAAYIEDTLGLRESGDYVKLVRRSPAGLDSSLGWLETEKVESKKEE